MLHGSECELRTLNHPHDSKRIRFASLSSQTRIRVWNFLPICLAAACVHVKCLEFEGKFELRGIRTYRFPPAVQICVLSSLLAVYSSLRLLNRRVRLLTSPPAAFSSQVVFYAFFKKFDFMLKVFRYCIVHSCVCLSTGQEMN